MSSKTLIIVESPHKAEKIQEFLGLFIPSYNCELMPPFLGL